MKELEWIGTRIDRNKAIMNIVQTSDMCWRNTIYIITPYFPN